MSVRTIVCALSAVLAAAPVAAQTVRATARESTRAFTTYPYDDPNPHPIVGRIYPYFRFDGFTDVGRQQQWKTVELENQYIKVLILPQIGGKIWAAIEKKSDRSFIYFNSVVKFRDIAMRGPWTSGGIEANYGIIGHTPTVAGPVDYVVRENADGSAECVIGALDLLTRSTWRLAIRLPANAAAFTTSSFWYNGSQLEEPYYTWMNAGLKAAGDLQFVYPGTSYLGHDGEVASWPVNRSNGRDISRYENNDFGGYKSYHVFGAYTDFFGAWWKADDLGMVRYAPRDEKPGKKIWIWGLSRQGMIWDKLLTDSDGQYVEVQSGRLFNQTADGSTLTPFKHRGFAPRSADRWTESWYPVVGTQGLVAADDRGALNVVQRNGWTVLTYSPVVPFTDTLVIASGRSTVVRRALTTQPLVLWRDSVRAIPDTLLRVTIGGVPLIRPASEIALSRPVTAPASFDWQSVYGQYLRGKEKLRDREFGAARAFLDSAIRRDSSFIPALADRAALALRALDDSLALRLTRRALSIDAYDPSANYHYGLASARLGRSADAHDGFDIASLSPEYRGAALIENARLAAREGNRVRADRDAAKARAASPDNLDAIALLALLARQRGDRVAAAAARRDLLAIDPLHTVADFERVLAGERTAAEFTGMLRSEFPTESLLEAASWYLAAGAYADADSVLALAGPAAEPLYWRAWIRSFADAAGATALLARADAQSTRMTFPFRAEADAVFAWAQRASSSWKPSYYRALVRWAAGDTTTARTLLVQLGDRPDDATIYTARAALLPTADADRDLARARALAPDDWRIGRMLADRAMKRGDTREAVTLATTYAAKRPRDYILGMVLASALAQDGEYAAAERQLAGLRVLPYEGAAEARALYREVKLMRAIEAMRARQFGAARSLVRAAREWPEHLGAGRPYQADIDERLEDLVDAEVLARSGKAPAARDVWRRLAEPASAGNDAITRMAARKLAGSPTAGSFDAGGSSVARVLAALVR